MYFYSRSDLMSTGYHIAVVGATGAVGTKMIEMLEKTTLPIKK
jgi:aspartate-semialdehyde dehydrogenase